MQIKARDQKLKERWEQLLTLLTDQFSETEEIEIEGVLYLIGLQELGKIHQRFKKDDNINIIHIRICTRAYPRNYFRCPKHRARVCNMRNKTQRKAPTYSSSSMVKTPMI